MKLVIPVLALWICLGCGSSEQPISDASEYAGEYSIIVEPGPADKRSPLLMSAMNTGQKLHLSIAKDGSYTTTMIIDGKLKDRGKLVKRGEGFGFKSDVAMDVADETVSFTSVSECVMTKVREGRYQWRASTLDTVMIVKDK
ncbi:MAG: hypothetical protein ABL949_15470 [Fimbriimonadaceae bacterium]